jgi:hypothetical protein
MLVRVGDCEAEVRVGALMSTPRLGFTDNFFCVSQALAPHRIAPIKYTGAFWGQCLQNVMEETIDQYDVLLTIDYDSIFTAKTVEALLTLLMFSGVDAIAPLQTKRESNTVMLAMAGSTPEEKVTVDGEWFNKPVRLVETAHFGCTMIRTEALRRVPKPWFIAHASERGDFRGGHLDEDLHFWKQWAAAGNTLGVATNISIGHAELMITWPSRVPACNGKVQQHSTEFWVKDREPPEGAWGFIK